MSTGSSIRIGFLGLGYWGRNLVRAFSTLGQKVEIRRVCDRHSENVSAALQLFPQAIASTDPDTLYRDAEVDLIVIATQASSHFEAARLALSHDKHVLIEKPFTAKAALAESLLDLAVQRGKRIFIDHTYLFSEGLSTFKREVLAQASTKGGVWISERADFGRFPKDCGPICHLLYHDLYLIDAVFGLTHLETGRAFSAKVISPFGADYATVILTDDQQRTYQLTASLVSGRKIRRVSFSSQAGTVWWDDLASEQRVTTHGKTLRAFSNGELAYEDAGEVGYAGKNSGVSPLESLAEHVVGCLRSGAPSKCDGRSALPLLSVIGKLEQSIVNGEEVTLAQ